MEGWIVKTNAPIALSSPDHCHPLGAKQDNTSGLPFIIEVEKRFSSPIKHIDLGCAGGQLVTEFHERGHLSIGLEGSDYNVVHSQFNWPQYHNKILFTCDITQPFQVLLDDKPAIFDIVTAWEFLEHIAESQLSSVFKAVYNLLSKDGMFYGSIASDSSLWEGEELHQTIRPFDWWMDKISTDFIISYEITNPVRTYGKSFSAKKKKND